MSRTLLTVDAFRGGLKEGQQLDGTVIRLANANAKLVESASRTMRFTFSDSTVDRSGDSIDVNGWELSHFKQNPVALWAHDSSAPPIGRASNIKRNTGKLIGDIEFAPVETYEFADTIFKLVKGGFINAVSVGFIPLEYSFVNEKDRPFGIDFKRQELLEISICPVPCNPAALVEARAKGINTGPLVEWAERLLDDEQVARVPRPLLEQVFREAKTPLSIRVKYFPAATEETKDVGDEEAVETEEAEADVTTLGNCGRTLEQECSLADPQQCSVHVASEYVAPSEGDDDLNAGLKRVKAGQALPRDAEDDLTKALEHHKQGAKLHLKALDYRRRSAAHQDAAHQLIKSVMARHDAYDPDGDGDDDTPGEGGDTDNDGGRGGGSDESAPHQFTSLRDAAKRTLDEVRAKMNADLTV